MFRLFGLLLVGLVLANTAGSHTGWAGDWSQSANFPTRDGYENNVSLNRRNFQQVSKPHPVRYGQLSERYLFASYAKVHGFGHARIDDPR